LVLGDGGQRQSNKKKKRRGEGEKKTAKVETKKPTD